MRLAAIAVCSSERIGDYQFAPVWSARDLADRKRCPGLAPEDFLIVRRGPGVAACAALWDQGDFKQTMVRGYAGWVAALRPLANAAAPLLRMPRLPAAGEPLRQVYLSHLAVADNDPALFSAIVDAGLAEARRRGFAVVLTGLATRHPLAAELVGATGTASIARSFTSCIGRRAPLRSRPSHRGCLTSRSRCSDAAHHVRPAQSRHRPVGRCDDAARLRHPQGRTPREIETTLVDERIEPLPHGRPTDLVAMTVETYTARRAYQIAAAYRRRGIPVVMGGYHPTMLPDEALQHADAVVIGDAEGAWEQRARRRRRRTAAAALSARQPARAAAPARSQHLQRQALCADLAGPVRTRLPLRLRLLLDPRLLRHRPAPARPVPTWWPRCGTLPRGRMVFFVDDNLFGDVDAFERADRALIPLEHALVLPDHASTSRKRRARCST